MIGNPKQLRNRPFLVISHSGKPARGVQTLKPGWVHDSKNWEVTENAEIVSRVSDKQLVESTVIIDLLNRVMVKNRHPQREAVDENAMMDTIMLRYSNEISGALSNWTK